MNSIISELMTFDIPQQLGAATVVAEGLFVLANNKSITILLKSQGQLTRGELQRVAHGLRREILGAFFIFVPISAALATFIIRPLIAKSSHFDDPLLAAVVGAVSYGFPYASIKAWAVRSAARFLREAADVADVAVLLDSAKEKSDAANV